MDAAPSYMIEPALLLEPYDGNTHMLLNPRVPNYTWAQALEDYDIALARSLVGPTAKLVIPVLGCRILEPPSPRHFGVHLTSFQMTLAFPLHPFIIEWLWGS